MRFELFEPYLAAPFRAVTSSPTQSKPAIGPAIPVDRVGTGRGEYRQFLIVLPRQTKKIIAVRLFRVLTGPNQLDARKAKR